MKEMNVKDIQKSLSRIDGIVYDLYKTNPKAAKSLAREWAFMSSMVDNALIEIEDEEFVWTEDDQLNAMICEASEGMLSLSHVG